MNRTSRLLAVLLLAAAPAAYAQPAPDAPPPPPPPSEQPAPHQHVSARAKFDAANTTHDGKLTLDQAQAARMRGVARHFTEIDVDHKGYVTWQDIRSWRHAKQQARHANRDAPPPPADQNAPPPPPPAPPPQ